MNTPTPDRGTDETDLDPVSDRAADRVYRWLLIGLGVAVFVIAAVGVTTWVTSSDDAQDPLGEVDIGFMQDMLDHHDQALVLSEAYLDCNPAGDAAPYAHEVIMFQTRDIGRMEEWLAEDGSSRGEPDRMTMTWMGSEMGSEMGMGMGMPVAEMQGMQPQERIDELASACGAEADVLFFELMTAHHLGGVLMADYAAEHGESEFLRVFAAGVVRNQLLEVDEYNGAVVRLGL